MFLLVQNSIGHSTLHSTSDHLNEIFKRAKYLVCTCGWIWKSAKGHLTLLPNTSKIYFSNNEKWCKMIKLKLHLTHLTWANLAGGPNAKEEEEEQEQVTFWFKKLTAISWLPSWPFEGTFNCSNCSVVILPCLMVHNLPKWFDLTVGNKRAK